MSELAFILIVLFFAVFTQAVAGFGAGLVAMPLLAAAVGIHRAAPLMAMVLLMLSVGMIWRHGRSIDLRQVRRLLVGTVVGIPLGMLLLAGAEERWLFTLLAAVIIGYALYALTDPSLPPLRRRGWAYGTGLFAGALATYNVGGPPVVIYGSCQGWEPAQLKSNIHGMSVVNMTLVVAGHSVGGRMTPEVVTWFALAAPVVVAGLVAGFTLDRYINAEVFRRLVLVLLLVIGARLLWVAWA